MARRNSARRFHVITTVFALETLGCLVRQTHTLSLLGARGGRAERCTLGISITRHQKGFS